MKSHCVWVITYNAKEYFNAIYIGYCLIRSEVRFTFFKKPKTKGILTFHKTFHNWA